MDPEAGHRYHLAEPLALTENEFVGIAELLAAALSQAQLDRDELRRIGADWGRCLSGRPAPHDPHEHIPKILARLGYRVRADGNELKLERCLCPLIAPDSPVTVCSLMEGVVGGALAAAGSDLRVDRADHHPEARSCRLRFAKPDR